MPKTHNEYIISIVNKDGVHDNTLPSRNWSLRLKEKSITLTLVLFKILVFCSSQVFALILIFLNVTLKYDVS